MDRHEESELALHDEESEKKKQVSRKAKNWSSKKISILKGLDFTDILNYSTIKLQHFLNKSKVSDKKNHHEVSHIRPIRKLHTFNGDQ